MHLGYHNNPAANAEAFLPDGWFRSGDLGMIDQDGVIAAGGVISSDVGLATARIAEQNEVPLFLVKSGATAILTPESRYTFRTCLPAAPISAAPPSTTSLTSSPKSQIVISPPPYWPFGIVPENSRYSSGWSSVWTALRFSSGSSGTPLGIAQEAALKLKETSGLHAEALSAAEVAYQAPRDATARDKRLFDVKAIALEEWQRSQAAEAAASAQLETAKQKLDQAQTQLGYCRIVAPTNSVVARRLADPGDLAVPGKPLLQLVSQQTVRVRAALPPQDFTTLHIGQAVTLQTGGASVDATVSRVFPAMSDSHLAPFERDVTTILEILNEQEGNVRRLVTAGLGRELSWDPVNIGHPDCHSIGYALIAGDAVVDALDGRDTPCPFFFRDGTPEPDRTELGVYFSPTKPDREMIFVPLINQSFTIPPNDPNYRVTAQLPIRRMPFPSELVLPLRQHAGAPAKPGSTVSMSCSSVRRR